MTPATLKRIASMGTYLPRRCRIATFTTDLPKAVVETNPDTARIALPINDVEAGYAYPSRVPFEIPKIDIES